MTSEPQSSAPIPFAIAVTGHRDLRPQDVVALRNEVRTVLAEIRSRAPNDPLLLLSALAEGADQLVAEVALEQGVFLAAVLPMPLDIYRVQMNDAAQQNLLRLFALSAVKIMISLEDRSPEQIRNSATVRAACYEALGRYLVRHGQVLIALWDGEDSNKPGGTCRVVQYARFGKSPGSAEEVESNCEVVYQVVTPRMSGHSSSKKVQTISLGCETDAPAQHEISLPDPKERAATILSDIPLNLARFSS